MKKIKFSFEIILFLTIGLHLSCLAQEKIFTDERDGKQYKIVEINNQIWMTDNLDFETENSWWYKDKKRLGKNNGRLYTWNDAMKVCPDGWHLPSDKDWNELIEFYGGEKNAGVELSIEGSSGLNVRLSGFRDSSGSFYDLGQDANFWNSTSIDKYNAWRCYFDRGYNAVIQDYFSKAGGLSVRCIKD